MYRETKKILKVKLGQPALKNRQVKGKAMKRLSRALPNRRPKRVDVVKILFRSLSLKSKQKVTVNNIVPMGDFRSI